MTYPVLLSAGFFVQKRRKPCFRLSCFNRKSKCNVDFIVCIRSCLCLFSGSDYFLKPVLYHTKPDCEGLSE